MTLDSLKMEVRRGNTLLKKNKKLKRKELKIKILTKVILYLILTKEI